MKKGLKSHPAFRKSNGDAMETNGIARTASPTISSHHTSANSSTEHTPALKPLKKLSGPPQEDTEEELRMELERCKESHDCNLSALELSEVPGGVPLTTLVSLSLAENLFTSLSGALFTGGKCATLVKLDLNSNQLTTLPVELFFLPLLETLSANSNRIVELPLAEAVKQSAKERPFLPSLRRVGLEFNALKRAPIEFLEMCPLLEELLLSLNEEMLNEEIPFARLAKVQHSAQSPISLKVDNRPRFVEQMTRERWATKLPWLRVDLMKIYPDRVLDFLYLGSLRTAQTVTVYRDLDISYVLTVGRELEVRVMPGMKHLVLPANDFPEQKMTPFFRDAFSFIDEARANKKGVLIHCFAGLSRSVTIAAAYIMTLKKMTRDDTLALIRNARPAARPNEGFLAELKEYEATIL